MTFWDESGRIAVAPFKIKKILFFESNRPKLPPFASTTHQPIESKDEKKIDPKGNGSNSPESSLPSTPTTLIKRDREDIFEEIFSVPIVDFESLKREAWNGILKKHRPAAWRILMKYSSVYLDKQEGLLEKKRREYREICQKYFTGGWKRSFEELVKSSDLDELILHQISIDVPRTCSDRAVFQHDKVRQCLLRILYCWSIRRPATGYVQGINDLVTPFFHVFVLEKCSEDAIETLSDSDFSNVEADTFWCFSNLLDSIQDNYTFNQSGIYRQMNQIYTITQRIDPLLVNHLETESVQFVQFTFRWLNCLLLREFRLETIERLWDGYMSVDTAGPGTAGSTGFRDFHVYVCAAFLLKWRRKLQLLEFQDLIVFLQALPTADWTDDDVEMLLSEAFVLQNLFQNQSK